MGIAERREREKQELRTVIINGARSILSERGYEGLTMRAVADRIEYSPAAIYKHFTDREDLVRAICSCDFYAFAQVLLTQAAREKSDDPLAEMRAIGHAYAEFGLRYPEQFRVMFMTPKPIDDSLIERGNPDEDAYASLEHAVGVAMSAGRFAGLLPALVAQTAWAAVHGVVSIEIALGGVEKHHIQFRPFAERVDAVLEACLSGLQTLADQKPSKSPRLKKSIHPRKKRS